MIQTRAQAKTSGIILPEVHRAKKVLVPHANPESLVKSICPIPPVHHQRPTHYILLTIQDLPSNTLPPIPKPRVGQGRAGIRRKPRVALPIPEGNQMPPPQYQSLNQEK